MPGSKYDDTTSSIQVIGCFLNKPELLEEDGQHFFHPEDFTNELHKIVYQACHNLVTTGGVKFLDANVIEDYLEKHPKTYAIYKSRNGSEWVASAKNKANLDNFEYHYQRLKKMSLLRGYEGLGVDVSYIYNGADELWDIAKKQEEEERLDSLSLLEIADIIDNNIAEIKDKYIDNVTDDSVSIGDGIENFLEHLDDEPDMGLPLYGDLVNTALRGARRGKFYLRSSATGLGKTRSMMADVCYLACDEIYDLQKKQWVSCGKSQATLYISTELELDEVRTMALAFLSGVNEEHILTNSYNAVNNELERVRYAAQVLKKAGNNFRVEVIPDFSLKDIENIIKRNIRLYGVKYVFYDYIHTSMKMLEEVTRRSGGIRLREDNILFLMSVKLKDICVQYNVFMLSSTQLNADYVDSKTPDQNLLRGAKSIADKIDSGMILLEVNPEELEDIGNIIKEKGCIVPNVKMSIYKNRRGALNRCYIWINADRGICRFEPLFVTDYKYNYINVEIQKYTYADEEGKVNVS